MFPVFMLLVTVHPARHWPTLHLKKELFVLKRLPIMKKNTTINPNHWIITMFRVVPIVILKLHLLDYTEKQAKDAGYEVKVGKFPLSASGKASAAGHTEGFVKVIFDAKYGEWLGTHMIGYNVTEMIVETVAARKLETTYHEVLNSIHPHPTISESVKDAIEVAYGEAIHL